MLDTNHFKERLQEERKKLEEELSTVGRKNPNNPSDWEATPDKGDDPMRADKNEVADSMEDYEGNTAILRELEIRLKNVNDALIRIDGGTYGKCENCNDSIPIERLEANPAARNCINHDSVSQKHTQ